MEVQPPLVSLGEQEPVGELSLEDQFAQILRAVMNDEISAATAIQMFQNASITMMQQYRDAASALLHRAAHYLHTRRLSADLESQAASWQLLQALYCSGDKPAGEALEGAADVGGQHTLRQLTAGLVNDNDVLRRVAQVVTWLESLAARQLQEAPAARFAHHEGLWRETLLSSGGLGSRAAAGTGVEMDPDATSRGTVTLSSGDRKGEERLAAHLWQLIRAGKLREGRQLCCQAGQAWRCLSLAGGGEWGPLPVGAAAEEAAEHIDQQAAADELACQVEGGLALGRLAWKWACYAAAQAAANGMPGNRWEAAVYGALCGHVSAMLPVCTSWEDEVWSYCRAWLDLQTDAMLLEGVEQQLPGAVQAMLGAGQENMVSKDLLEKCVSQAAASGYSSSTDTALLRDGLTVMAGAWPMTRLLTEAEGCLVPRNFSELLQLISNSRNPKVKSESQQQQHLLQLLLMSEDWGSITMELAAAALAAGDQLQQIQQQQAGQQNAGADAEEQMEYEGVLSTAVEDEGARMSAESACGVLRFTAHWALCLRALGLVPDHTWSVDDDEEAEWARLQTALGKVIYQYALQLAQQHDTLVLVPLYLCHLRLGLRQSLVEVLLANATDLLEDEECQALYLQLLSCTEHWRERQLRLQELVLEQGKVPGPYWDVDEVDGDYLENVEGQGLMGLGSSDARVRQPSSCLFGDLRPEELRLLLQHLVSNGFASSSTSPLQRCRQLRWLFYSFTGAIALQQQQHAALFAAGTAAVEGAEFAPAPAAALTGHGDLAWQGIWADALGYALSLASEFVLNPGFGSDGLQTLLGEVIPHDYLEAASRVAADQLDDPAQQLQVQRQLLALAFWQRYTELDAAYQQWKERWAAALTSGDDAAAAAELGEAAEQGQQLVSSMLALVLEDQLRLPAPAELVQILAPGVGGDGAAVAVSIVEGECLGLPRFDDGEEKPSELVLAVTVARETADPDLPFDQMEGREAEALQQQLNRFLSAATTTTPDVSFQTALPDTTHDLSGTVLVSLMSYSADVDESAPPEEKARLGRRMLKAWQDMVALASGMLGGSSSSSSSANEQAAVAAADAAGDAIELPRLSLVHVSGSCSTRLAMSRRRTTSKLLRRSGKVLLNLARAGHPSSQLDVLISAAGDAAGRDGPALLELLSQGDAGKLLVLLEQAIEEGGLLEEGADVDTSQL